MNKRRKITKKHFDEICEDTRLSDSESHFRINVFNRCLDICITKLNERFKGTNNVADIFQAIQPSQLATLSDDELFKAAEKIVTQYSDDVSSNFPMELVSVRSHLLSDIKKTTSVEELAKLLIIENSSISTSFPEVCTVLLLFLTIPVTVATSERSFSKLKIIKTYLRNSMGQKRLCSLSLISIEQEEARKLKNNMDGVIKLFTETKVRKKSFN